MRVAPITAVLAATLLVSAGCESDTTAPVAPDAAFKKAAPGKSVLMDQTPVPMDMSAWNAGLAEKGLAIAYFEYVTAPSAADQAGRTVFASDRGNKQLSADWVPGDPRREGRTSITWATDGTEATTSSGPDAAATIAATQRAMATWQDITCSEIPLADLGVAPFDLGYVQWVFGFGGIPGYVADLTHAGFLPGAFFDALAPGGSGFILGVTFTLVWIDGGSPTDIDGNGKSDVAFREIYYNDAFDWAIDSDFSQIDVESIVLHETGHGLSQAHFGDIFFDGSGVASLRHLHFAPYAVMNAAYWDTQQELTGTDTAGHCSNWGSWPTN